jgi:hypothetical protein
MDMSPEEMRTLTPQERRVMHLREHDTTFRVIGDVIGVSTEEAHRIFNGVKNELSVQPHWTDALSFRVRSVLFSMDLHEKEAVKDALDREILHPCKGEKPRNYGWTSHYELMYFIKNNP